ncbi:MAG: type II toxin-antitoxin system Phd/YefM family antitoxin [Coriobacteriia bacterium]|nr:type II toxin-antitoxin system Phd/YefM family antitoxin [Coriobacteriia bacterium]
MATYTIGLAEAKKNFSKITAAVNQLGQPVTVLKNNRPWVVIQPVSEAEGNVAVDLLEGVSYSAISLEEDEN